MTINDVLKINALSCLAFGSLFVFAPDPVTSYLSGSETMPQLVLLSLGVILNLYGLALLWLASKNPVPQTALLLVATGDFLWVIATIVLIQLKLWITTINGITAAGVVAIFIGWLGWIQFKHYLAHKI